MCIFFSTFENCLHPSLMEEGCVTIVTSQTRGAQQSHYLYLFNKQKDLYLHLYSDRRPEGCGLCHIMLG